MPVGYIPAWLPFPEALGLVDKADLLAALYDGVVAARFADGEGIEAAKWCPPVVLLNRGSDGRWPLLGSSRDGDIRLIELCRADVDELAHKTKGPARALIPAATVASQDGRMVAPDPEYPIRDRHSAYEWAMTLGAEVHPHGHYIADLFGSRGDLRADTVAGMQARESAAEGWSEQTKAIYYALKAEFEAGDLKPLRREWCADRLGIDPADILDFTRCVFGFDQVLALIRRRGETGRLIGELLAADSTLEEKAAAVPPEAEPPRRAPDSEIHKAIGEVYDTAATDQTKPPNLREIAAPVQAILHERGFETSGNHIQRLASDGRYIERRRKPGKTLASEMRQKPS
jgi:hypothetical protein